MKKVNESLIVLIMFFLGIMIYQLICCNINIIECIVWSAIMWFVANVIMWFVE